MTPTTQAEINKLINLEPEILYELVEELTLALEGEEMKNGYVYLMQYPSGFYKIGFSKIPLNRQYQLEYDDKNLEVKVEVVHIIQTDDMKRLERDIANLFNHSSTYIGREMWNLSQEDLFQFCSIRKAWYKNLGPKHLSIF